MDARPSQRFERTYSRDAVRRGIRHYLLGRALSGVASFTTIILLVRFMDIEAYAGFTALTGLTTLGTILSDLGLERVIARYVPEARLRGHSRLLAQLVRRLALVRLIAASTFVAIIAVLWINVAAMLNIRGLVDFPVAFAFLVLSTTLFQLFTAVMQALLQQKLLASILTIQWGGRLSMVLIAVWALDTIPLAHAIWILALPELVGVSIFALCLRREFRAFESLAAPDAAAPLTEHPAWPNPIEVRRMALQNYWFNVLAAPPQAYFMRLVAAALLPPPLVAAYGFFSSLSERARQYLPVQLFNALAEPVLIAGYLQDRDFVKLRERSHMLLKINLVVLVPALTFVLTSGDDFAALLTAGKYMDEAWILAVAIIQLILVTMILLAKVAISAVDRNAMLIFSAVTGLVVMFSFAAAVFLLGATTWIIVAPLSYFFTVAVLLIRGLGLSGHTYRLPAKSLLKIALLASIALAGADIVNCSIEMAALTEVFVGALITFGVFCVGTLSLRVFSSAEVQLLFTILGLRARPQTSGVIRK